MWQTLEKERANEAAPLYTIDRVRLRTKGKNRQSNDQNTLQVTPAICGTSTSWAGQDANIMAGLDSRDGFCESESKILTHTVE